MNSRKIDDAFSVSEQITPEDVKSIAAAGFRSIVCNRPDDEGPGQPRFSEIAAAARAAGLASAYLPVVSGGIAERDVRRFAELIETLPGPVLGFCRSGARSAALWQAAQPVVKAG